MENNILGIETSGKVCSVALYTKNSYKEININTGLTHSETLFPNVNQLLNNNNLQVKDLSYIAVSNGPGSYTGLRIGISCALGLSIVDNIKIRYVNTLKALNYNINDFISNNNIILNENDIIVSILDAKANRVYLGLSRFNAINNFIIEKIVSIDELIEMLNEYNDDFYILGDGVDIYKDIISSRYNKQNIHFLAEDYNYLNAKNVIEASKNIENYIENININYMQKSQAERNRINNV